jgi:cytochrome P450
MENARTAEDAQRIPRVSGLPLVGSLPSVLAGQFRFLEQSLADKGGIFELDLGVTNAVLIADPEVAEAVLIDKARNFDKGEDFWDGLREVLGLGLAMSEGELWRRQRKLMQPEFQRRLIESYRSTIEETVSQELESLRAGVPIDIASWCDELLAALTVRILFGSDLDHSRIDELRRTMAGLFQTVLAGLVTRKLPRWLPRPGRQRVEQARRAVDQNVLALIAERRQRPGTGNDVLGTLIRATDDSGVMSDQQLRDEAVTIYVAGYETTGTALAWTLWLLASHPRILADLQDELDAETEDKPLLHACIREGLRMFPPGPLLPRRTVADDVLGGFPVPAGTTVVVSPWLIHHDPNLWPRPHAFEPQRFMDAEASRNRPRLAWIPFGAGQRICIGKALAMLELERAVELFLRRFTPTVATNKAPPKPRLSTTLRSSTGIHLTLRPR